MTQKEDQNTSAVYLRSARPHLICRVEAEGGRPLEVEGNQRDVLTPYISEVELGWDEVLSEGYDPDGSPLRRPVYWRIVDRGDERLYCSTFLVGRAEIIKRWGTKALAYCHPVTGRAVARTETLLAVNKKLKDHEMTKTIENSLDNLTAALKTVYGHKTEAAFLLLRHCVKANCGIAKETPETLRKIEESYIKKFHSAKPSDRNKAVDLLNVYVEHFFKTATPEERAAFAIAGGYTPVEFEITMEGFSMRELMQAVKKLEAYKPIPEDLLIEFFERYVRLFPEQKQLTTKLPQLIALYRREPAMKSGERAIAILKELGMEVLYSNKSEDMQKWKEVSGARVH
jgi:hypothetical protein